MRPKILWPIVAGCLLVPVFAEEPIGKREVPIRDAFFEELMAELPRDGDRGRTARLELQYWHQYPGSCSRHPAKTKDGKAAEVVFFTASTKSIPGADFAIAFLLIEKRLVDWASCWTHNRTAKQQLLLEDVDGDGFSDVAFRAIEGTAGLRDRRVIDRKWLYAYSITGRGFNSLFPSVDRDVKVVTLTETANQPVRLEIKGLRGTLREHQMSECTISVTNTSQNDLPIKVAKWFEVQSKQAGFITTQVESEEIMLLKRGESISQVVQLVVYEVETEVTIRWKFVPNEAVPDAR